MASRTVFGYGEYWENTCKGVHSSFSHQESINACQYFLIGFQLGGITQALKLKKSPTMCGGSQHEPESIHKSFVEFMERNESLRNQDILQVLPLFFENEEDCGL